MNYPYTRIISSVTFCVSPVFISYMYDWIMFVKIISAANLNHNLIRGYLYKGNKVNCILQTMYELLLC